MALLRIGNYPFAGPEAATCSAKTFEPGPKCKYPGYGPETIGFLSDYLRKPYEIINLKENEPIGGLQSDGRWSGMLGLLQNGTVDALSAPWILTDIRRQYFSFTVPTHVFPSSYVIGTQPPSTFEVASRIFVTFHWNLLVTVFITIFILFATLVGTHYYWAKNDPAKSSASFHGELVRTATAKHMKQPKIGTKILVLIYTIVIVLFTDLYRDSLLVYLLIPHKDLRVSEDMIWQMVKSKQLKMVAVRDNYHNSGVWQNIHDGNNTKFKEFKQTLEANPPMIVETLNEVLTIFAANPSDLVYYTDLMHATQMIMDIPHLSMVDVQDPDQNVYGYMFRKNSTLVEEFDEAIKRNTAFIYSRQNYYIRLRGDGTKEQGIKKDIVSPLSMVQLLGAFVLFAIGIIIALISLIAEKCFELLIKHRLNAAMPNEFGILNNCGGDANIAPLQEKTDEEFFELKFTDQVNIEDSLTVTARSMDP